MALPLWGELEKSVDDPTTIEEEIESLIAAHNEDSDAHLGSNQSLESHKAENVIDHPAGSVLADKMTDREFTFSTIFQTLENVTTSGEVSNDEMPGASLYIESGFAEESELDMYFVRPPDIFDTEKDMMFEAYVEWDGSNNNYIVHCGLMLLFSSTYEGMGFRIENGDLYGIIGDYGDPYETGAITVDFTSPQFVRVIYTASDNLMKVIVNGTQVGSVTYGGPANKREASILCNIQTDGTNDGTFYLNRASIAREI